jgi:thiamine-monophosphate kinase
MGDAIFVSGTLGEAELGLRQLLGKKGVAPRASRELRKHLYPQPRLALGRWLAERQLATAAMDLSDGLSSDLRRLCAASGVGARIEFASLPVTGGVPVPEARRLALHGGDDYELLFTVARKNVGKMPTQFRGLKLTKIGEITRSRPLVVDHSGKLQKLEARGWDPFRR